MKKQVLMNLVLALMISGLVFTVSCAKKQVVSEPVVAIEDTTDADAAARAAALEKQRAMEEEMLRQKALKEASLSEAARAQKAAALERFVDQNVQFDFDSSELTPMARAILKEKALWLGENSGVRIIIEGHCDERGTLEYNLALGERRAAAAQKYLIDLGIFQSRMSTISYGEERPLDPAHNAAAWAKNRRAQFVIK
ncbi:MAG: peptidoglycan-associated lipoprotein Pal [Desulfobacterium sp.]|nr:peptidoglycan-associated lipoprotein Pal [Desulfobacterium sp.]